MKIEAGKTYVTKDGTKVGPMKEYDYAGNRLFISEGDELSPLHTGGGALAKPQKWYENGTVFVGCAAEAGHVIVSEYKEPFKLQVVEGRYYETAEGKLEGPMKIQHAFSRVVVGPVFQSEVVNTTQGNRGIAPQYWKEDGSAYLPVGSESKHHFVAERAAPDFNLEDGKTYVMANGEKVGPMEETDLGYFVCEGFLCDKKNYPDLSEGGMTPRQVWEKDGSIHYPMAGEDLLHIVREAPVEQELVIKVNTDDIQELVDEVRAEIEAAAGEALKKVEEAQAETAAIKDAFNIACEDVKARDARIVSLNSLVDRKNLALNHYCATVGQLQERNNVLRQSLHERDAIIDNLEATVTSFKGQLDRERWRKERGDVRLRQARHRFATMARKADEAELEAERLTVELSKKAKFDVGNFIIGIIMLACVAATGWFVPWVLS